MSAKFRNAVRTICAASCRHPAAWFLVTLLLSLPAFYSIRNLGLDTNLIRLLPSHSPAAEWTRELEKVVSDGGYFTILLESGDREKLIRAVEDTAARVEKLEGVHSVEYRYPLAFIEHYRYMLVPDYYLDKILDYLIGLEAETSPFTEDLMIETGGDAESSEKEKREQGEMERLMAQYSHLTEYHESRDGRVMGMFIRPESGVTDLAGLRDLLLDLEKVAEDAARKYGLWAGVGGSQIENLKEYDVIVTDLERSGLIACTAIVLILILVFRAVRVLPVLLYPLGLGMLWAFSLVPPILGDLNTITSFLLLVLFGMGIDYSIHLVKRFQVELASKSPEEALTETCLSTGQSVLISGLTTAFALLILTFSNFRGFSEFGMIGGGAIAAMLLAMQLVMPVTLILGYRMGLVKPIKDIRRRRLLPPGYLIVLLLAALVAAGIFAGARLSFDYNFNHLKPDIRASEAFNQRNSQVYSKYMSPGAIYVAPDLDSLDRLLDALDAQRINKTSLFKRVSSIRDYAPGDARGEDRLSLVAEIKDQVQGRWVARIDDPDISQWINDIRTWTPPESYPAIGELPPAVKTGVETKEGSGRYLVGVYPSVPRGNGRNAMAFTEELYDLEIPAGVQGPVGEMPVFAEILWIVTEEGPWMVAATFLGIICIVLFGRRSFRQTLWVMFPLFGGMVLTLGLMAGTGLQLNFFNVVVIPALIGMGVDHGVHFYRRWKEMGRNEQAVQRELFGPLSACTITTMMGYSGMIFASHPGLKSIGIIACIGLSCIWLTSLVLFPGLLRWYYKNRMID